MNQLGRIAALSLLMGVLFSWPNLRADEPVDYSHDLALVRSNIARVETDVAELQKKLEVPRISKAAKAHVFRELVRKKNLLGRLQDRELSLRSRFRASGGHDSWDPNELLTYIPYTAFENGQISDLRAGKQVPPTQDCESSVKKINSGKGTDKPEAK